jgi:hypothetical protein
VAGRPRRTRMTITTFGDLSAAAAGRPRAVIRLAGRTSTNDPVTTPPTSSVAGAPGQIGRQTVELPGRRQAGSRRDSLSPALAKSCQPSGPSRKQPNMGDWRRLTPTGRGSGRGEGISPHPTRGPRTPRACLRLDGGPAAQLALAYSCRAGGGAALEAANGRSAAPVTSVPAKRGRRPLAGRRRVKAMRLRRAGPRSTGNEAGRWTEPSPVSLRAGLSATPGRRAPLFAATLRAGRLRL